MSKTAVRSNITVFSADIAEVRSKGLPYVLGWEASPTILDCPLMVLVLYRETNSIACHGAPGVSNTAGAALWGIDYTLQAATNGIVETYFHEGV